MSHVLRFPWVSKFFYKNYKFPWVFSEILRIFRIPWVFQVFQVCGYPVLVNSEQRIVFIDHQQIYLVCANCSLLYRASTPNCSRWVSFVTWTGQNRVNVLYFPCRNNAHQILKTSVALHTVTSYRQIRHRWKATDRLEIDFCYFNTITAFNLKSQRDDNNLTISSFALLDTKLWLKENDDLHTWIYLWSSFKFIHSNMQDSCKLFSALSLNQKSLHIYILVSNSQSFISIIERVACPLRPGETGQHC